MKGPSRAVESDSTPPPAGRNARIFFTSISLSLEKPLGLILEKAEVGNVEAGGGVVVTQVNEGRLAFDTLHTGRAWLDRRSAPSWGGT
ncbi:hypothetical protein ACHAWF_012426 [Thalassiosira exigua]